MIISQESASQRVECMICGIIITLSDMVDADMSFTCFGCGSNFEIASRAPFVIHFPAQECGE